jgi:hypothetical protein
LRVILPARRILAGLAVVAASLAVASCGKGRETRSQFERIDRAVTELNLAALGSLRLDERLGRVGFAQQPPTRVLVLEMEKPSAAAAAGMIDSKLRQAGYQAEYFKEPCGTSSPCRFRRPSDNVTIGLVVYQPGQTVKEPTAEEPKYETTVPKNAIVTSLAFGNE